MRTWRRGWRTGKQRKNGRAKIRRMVLQNAAGAKCVGADERRMAATLARASETGAIGVMVNITWRQNAR